MEQEKNLPAEVNQQTQEQNLQINTDQIQSPFEAPTPEVRYAGFWIRFLANFIDGFVLIIPNFISGLIVNLTTTGVTQKALSFVSGILISWIYFILMTDKYQATIGKKALGLIVISEKKERLKLEQVATRETIGKLASAFTLLVGYLMIAFTEKKQGLHDKIAGSIVIYRDPGKKNSKWIIVAIILACALPLVAIIGIFASITLISLNSARGKAQDASIKETLSATLPDAILYEDTNSSYKGYKIDSSINIIECSSQPVVNISTDGKEMAIFMKSCTEKEKYFCANPVTGLVTETAEINEDYVRNGATICNSADISKVSADEKKNSTSDNIETVSNYFRDDLLGYDISYPVNWVQQKEADEETGVTTITFLPKIENPAATIYIQSFRGQELINLEEMNDFIGSMQGELSNVNAKIYDTKDFIYTYADGTKSTGKAFKAEYSDGGLNFKQWLIAIPNGKDLHWLTYVSTSDQYDSNYNIAISMIDSWKIFK